MMKEARSVPEDWSADLAAVGLVKRSDEVLSLWLVSRSGEGTLGRGDIFYELVVHVRSDPQKLDT